VAAGEVLGPLEETLDAVPTPHLSFSRINRYLLCPEQYRLHYVENLRPKRESASLAFGAVVHRALAGHLGSRADPVGWFEREWDSLKEAPLRHSRSDSWQSLRDQGRGLLETFTAQETSKIGTVFGVERPFQLAISTLEVPFIGTIDLVAEIRHKRTVVDFKTSHSHYAAHEVLLADQLTAYQIGEPRADQVAFCVFVKTKRPQIEWQLSRRTPEQLLAYLSKAEYVGKQIEWGRFFLRPGKWCAQCDYLPICTGEKQKAKETLVQIDQPQQR
jgi:RecB family exonuclease